MQFRQVDASVWRWCGWALNLGALPLDGRTELRMAVLRNLLELRYGASDADVEAELQLFKSHGKRRT